MYTENIGIFSTISLSFSPYLLLTCAGHPLKLEVGGLGGIFQKQIIIINSINWESAHLEMTVVGSGEMEWAIVVYGCQVIFYYFKSDF